MHNIQFNHTKILLGCMEAVFQFNKNVKSDFLNNLLYRTREFATCNTAPYQTYTVHFSAIFHWTKRDTQISYIFPHIFVFFQLYYHTNVDSSHIARCKAFDTSYCTTLNTLIIAQMAETCWTYSKGWLGIPINSEHNELLIFVITLHKILIIQSQRWWCWKVV